jgi:hypothetical protein
LGHSRRWARKAAQVAERCPQARQVYPRSRGGCSPPLASAALLRCENGSLSNLDDSLPSSVGGARYVHVGVG